MAFLRKKSLFERLTGSVPLNNGENDRRPTLRDQEPYPADDPEEGELSLDVYQTPTEIVIKTMIAGVKPEDLEISITREMVSIRGRREMSHEVATEDYVQKELYWGSFSRTVHLPSEIDVEEAEALEKHGLLTIRLPKIDKAKSQTLKVKTL